MSATTELVRAQAQEPVVAPEPVELKDAAKQRHVPRECLIFRLGNEEYGIDILHVQEIRSYEEPTRIAGAPPSVKGVVNLRGVIVPIVDLRLQFGLGEARYDGSTVVIVLNLGGRVVGTVVDSVSDVIELAAETVKPAPHFSSNVPCEHILGVATLRQGDAQRMLIVTDIARLIGGSDLGLAPAATALPH